MNIDKMTAKQTRVRTRR